MNENRIFNDVLEARNGHYCHCLELDGVYSLEAVIESFIDSEGEKYTEQEYIDFFQSMEIYYFVNDGVESKEDEEELYNFNISQAIKDMY